MHVYQCSSFLDYHQPNKTFIRAMQSMRRSNGDRIAGRRTEDNQQPCAFAMYTGAWVTVKVRAIG